MPRPPREGGYADVLLWCRSGHLASKRLDPDVGPLSYAGEPITIPRTADGMPDEMRRELLGARSVGLGRHVGGGLLARGVAVVLGVRDIVRGRRRVGGGAGGHAGVLGLAVVAAAR